MMPKGSLGRISMRDSTPLSDAKVNGARLLKNKAPAPTRPFCTNSLRRIIVALLTETLRKASSQLHSHAIFAKCFVALSIVNGFSLAASLRVVAPLVPNWAGRIHLAAKLTLFPFGSSFTSGIYSGTDSANTFSFEAERPEDD